MEFRKERMTALVKDVAASFLKSKSKPGILISATRVDMSKDFKNATVFVTVFPEKAEEEVLGDLLGKGWELRNYAKGRLKIKFLPSFRFELDKGEKARQRMQVILNEEE
ncbi:MAG: ribosome-binding factor A [bacterium]|nr:ribosome-binding factor A [bacterium]